MLVGQHYTYCRFVPFGSEQISLNCIDVLPNTTSIPMMNACTLSSEDSFSTAPKIICRPVEPWVYVDVTINEAKL